MLKKNVFFTRNALKIVLLLTFVLPIVLMGAKRTLRGNKNDVKEWLPPSYRETDEYKWFQKNFANEMFVLISWDGCTLDDERLKILEAKTMPGESVPYQGQKLFSRLITGQKAVEEMTGPPLNLTEAEAINRLRGSLIGPDPKVNQTCAVFTLSKYGKEQPRKVVETITSAALESGVPKESIHMGGPPVDNVALDKEGERMLLLLAGLSGAIGFGLTWYYMQNGRLVGFVIFSSIYSAALGLAIVTFTGNTMDSILLNMPSIVYTMGMSGAIHIINYWRHNAAKYGQEGATTRGLKMAWLPCMLSAGTTSLGLVSLCTSELSPIKKFGLYSAMGVMGTLVLLYTYVPSALELWGPKIDKIDPNAPQVPDEREEDHRRRMRWIADFISNHQAAVWAAFLLIMLGAGLGLSRIKTSISLMAMFSKDSDIVRSYAWLEDHLGPLVPMEVVVRLDEKNCNLTFLERMELVQQIQARIETLKDVGRTISTDTFAPDISSVKVSGMKKVSALAATHRSVLSKRLQEHRADFMKQDYLAVDDGQELWRVNVRVAALKNVDYGAFVEDIRHVVDPVIEAKQQHGAKGIVGVTYTGLTPLVYKAERSLLSGLIESFCWAFVMIAAVIALNFRSVLAGLVTMIPTVWPVILVFGMLGWLGIDVDIGTMMTAGVAMGVSVDDTLHFATWFRRGIRMGLDRKAAIRFAYENAAKAMYQSSFVVGFGLAAFGISAFIPTRRFGLLMMTLLNFGLLADLVLTPAIMAGPLGRFYTKWWLKPKALETPAMVSVHPAEASPVPAPHGPLAPAPNVIPLPHAQPAAARRVDTATPSGREAAQ